jgi:hypothetical protein
MITTVFHSCRNSVIRFITSSHVFVSNAHVGSSARISAGFMAKALAMAILCCCHPDNSFGLLSNLSSNQTLIRAFLALSSLSLFLIPW